MSAVKHPDFPQWIQSKQGSECCNIGTLTGPDYLKNRLFWAFDAGRDCVWDQYVAAKEENAKLDDHNALLLEENKKLREALKNVRGLLYTKDEETGGEIVHPMYADFGTVLTTIDVALSQPKEQTP